MEPGARVVGEGFMVFPSCPETVDTASKYISDARHKISLRNSADGYIRVLINRSLRILGIGRWLRRIWILLNLIPFQRLLRALRLFVLELLECSHGFLRFLHAMKAPVDDSELIPSLLDDVEVRTGRGGGVLQMLSCSSVIPKQHFCAAKIVVHVKQARFFTERCFDQLFPLGAVTLFNGEYAQLVSGEHVVGIDLQLALECFFGFLTLSEVAILRTQLLMQARLCGSEFDRRLVFHNGIHVPVSLSVRLGNHLMYAPEM